MKSELIIFLACLLFGVTVFPYIFAFFFFLAIGQLQDYPSLFINWDGVFRDLFRGDVFIWSVALLPYVVVQAVRWGSWLIRKRG